jgi:putative transposase
LSVDDARRCIEPLSQEISIARQCELLGLNRSSFYYQPVSQVDDINLRLMRKLDELYTEHPYYGVRRMTACLRRNQEEVNIKRVRRLLRLMGLEAIYPKKNLSKANKEHVIYPYLLRGVAIVRNDQVWSTDITYIRLRNGFVYLMAVIDWFSRYVLDWQLNITLEADFCIETLDRVLQNGKPEIFNTDQGSQFTTPRFVNPLLNNGVRVSMDGRGRALDNVFVERLWRSLKQEKVYLEDFRTVKEAKTGIADYFEYYNHRRPHQSLDYKTPAEVYLG